MVVRPTRADRGGRSHTRSLTHRLVVPLTFLPVLRAEQTTTTLLEAKLALESQYQYIGGVQEANW